MLLAEVLSPALGLAGLEDELTAPTCRDLALLRVGLLLRLGMLECVWEWVASDLAL